MTSNQQFGHANAFKKCINAPTGPIACFWKGYEALTSTFLQPHCQVLISYMGIFIWNSATYWISRSGKAFYLLIMWFNVPTLQRR